MKVVIFGLILFLFLTSCTSKVEESNFVEGQKSISNDIKNINSIESNIMEPKSEKIPKNEYEAESKVEKEDSEIIQLSKYFSKDDNFVYSNGEKLLGADINSFEVISTFYAKDAQYVYNTEGIIDGVDSKTFEWYEESRFFRDVNGVYNTGKGFKKVEKADPESFIALKNGYGKDDNNVYFYYGILEEYDAPSFKVLTETKGWPADEKPIYLKDKYKVTTGELKIDSVDPSSFELLKDGYYAKDKDNVFWGGNIIDGIDYDSFAVVSESIAKDKNYEYKNGKKIEK